MKRRARTCLASVAAIAGFAVVAPPSVSAQTSNTVDNTAMPSVIRVAVRANNDPRGAILWVQTVGFQEYCDDVLPNEWMSSWSSQALRAGAVAIKMFAWYHSLHPVTVDGFTFDVDNTTNFQEYKYLSATTLTDTAVQDTWRLVLVPQTGEILQLDYRAGIPNNPNWAFVGSQRMAQWGTEYWGQVARLSYVSILSLYYPGRSIRWI